MAQGKKSSNDSTPIRISAKDASSTKKRIAAEVESSNTKKAEKTTRRHPLVAISDYFSGAWYELRQVRWPTRKATWGLTIAILIFTAFFIILIILLDSGFNLLFERILG